MVTPLPMRGRPPLTSELGAGDGAARGVCVKLGRSENTMRAKTSGDKETAGCGEPLGSRVSGERC